MVKLPHLSGKEVILLLQKEGFLIKRQKGSHVTLFKHKERRGLYVTIPLHGNKEILPSTLLSIIRQAGMIKEEFVGLLSK